MKEPVLHDSIPQFTKIAKALLLQTKVDPNKKTFDFNAKPCIKFVLCVCCSMKNSASVSLLKKCVKYRIKM